MSGGFYIAATLTSGDRPLAPDEVVPHALMRAGTLEHVETLTLTGHDLSILSRQLEAGREALAMAEAMARIAKERDDLRAERDRARGTAALLEEEYNRIAGLRLLDLIYPPRRSPGEVPRWDEDPVVLRFGWLADRCGRCGEEYPADLLDAAQERDELRAVIEKVRDYATSVRARDGSDWCLGRSCVGQDVLDLVAPWAAPVDGAS